MAFSYLVIIKSMTHTLVKCSFHFRFTHFFEEMNALRYLGREGKKKKRTARVFTTYFLFTTYIPYLNISAKVAHGRRADEFFTKKKYVVYTRAVHLTSTCGPFDFFAIYYFFSRNCRFLNSF